MTTAKTVQQLLDGAWRFAAEAREACDSPEAWRQFQRKQKPPPSKLRISSRRAYNACVDEAVAMLKEPRVIRVEIVPVWVGDNPDEEAHGEWFAAHAVRLGDGPLQLWEPGPILEDVSPTIESMAVCEVRCRVGGYVVDSAPYPDSALDFRAGAYGVVASRCLELLSFFEEELGGPQARPRAEVPPFSVLVRPRVEALPSPMAAEVSSLGSSAGQARGVG